MTVEAGKRAREERARDLARRGEKRILCESPASFSRIASATLTGDTSHDICPLFGKERGQGHRERRVAVRNSGEVVILVTGATDRLGRMTARDLADTGATVLLHGRDPERGEAAVREIREEIGNVRLHY